LGQDEKRRVGEANAVCTDGTSCGLVEKRSLYFLMKVGFKLKGRDELLEKQAAKLQAKLLLEPITT
jgi:hypothetical protein